MRINFKKLLITSLIISLLLPNTTLYAAEISEGNLTNGTTSQDIFVNASKDGTFAVEIPTLVSLDIKNRKIPTNYNNLYCSPHIISNLDRSKYIEVSLSDLQLNRENTDEVYNTKHLKYYPCLSGELANQLFHIIYSIPGRNVYDYLSDQYTLPYKLPAGKYTGYITADINIKDIGYVDVDVMQKYIEPNTDVPIITIPDEINGILINAVNLYAIKTIYPNLEKLVFPRSSNLAVVCCNERIGYDSKNEVECKYKIDHTTLDKSFTIDANESNVGWYITPYTGDFNIINPGQYSDYSEIRNGTLDTSFYVPSNQFSRYEINFDDVYNAKITDDTLLSATTMYETNAVNLSVSTLNTIRLNGKQFTNNIGSTISSLKSVYIDQTVSSSFTGIDSLEEVTFSDKIEYIGYGAFDRCPNITKVNLPEKVKYIDPHAFAGTKFQTELMKHPDENGNIWLAGNLISHINNVDDNGVCELSYTTSGSTVDLSTIPAEATKLVLNKDYNGEFIGFTGSNNNITELDLSNADSTSDSTLKANFPNLKTVYLPKNIRGYNTWTSFDKDNSIQNVQLGNRTESIGNYTFNHYTAYTGSSFTINESLKTIGTGLGAHCFYDMGKDNVFKEFKVDKNNQYFEADDGVLYSKGKVNLISIPRAKVFSDNTFYMPDTLENMGELSFSRNTSINKLVIGDSYIFRPDINDESIKSTLYPEVLNYGNSLHTSIYTFAPVTSYEVKESNPNYKSIDGCLYSKDGKHLLAVPYKYSGELNIAEGCEYIDKNAFWLPKYTGNYANCDSNISKITLPSTLKEIDKDQLDFLSSICSKVYTNSPNFAIEMHYPTKTLVDIKQDSNSLTTILRKAEQKVLDSGESFTLSTDKYDYEPRLGYWTMTGSSYGADKTNDVLTFDSVWLKAGTYQIDYEYDSSLLPSNGYVRAIVSDGNMIHSDHNSHNIRIDVHNHKKFDLTEDAFVNFMYITSIGYQAASSEQEQAMIDSTKIKVTRIVSYDYSSMPLNTKIRVDRDIKLNASYWIDSNKAYHGESVNYRFMYDDIKLSAGKYTLQVNSTSDLVNDKAEISLCAGNSNNEWKYIQPTSGHVYVGRDTEGDQFTFELDEPMTLRIRVDNGQNKAFTDDQKARMQQELNTYLTKIE